MPVEEVYADGTDPATTTCYVAHQEEACSRDELLLITDEQVGRRPDQVRLFVGLAGPLSEIAVSWRVRGATVPVEDAAAALRNPESMLVALRRLYNAFARITNTAERAGFAALADQSCRLVASIEEIRQMAIDQVAYEMRRRDAMAAMEDDPSLSLQEVAERYGLDLVDADSSD